MTHKPPNIKIGARLSLFIVSYLPLFTLMIFRHVYTYREYLTGSKYSVYGVGTYFKYFSIPVVLIILSIFGSVGLFLLLKNSSRRAANSGEPITVKDVENRNSDSISYLFTYIIPFVFQDLSKVNDVVAIIILLVVTFLIYSNSNMLLVNPVLSIRYALYEMEYSKTDDAGTRKALVLSATKGIEEGEMLRITRISHKLYFGLIVENSYDR